MKLITASFIFILIGGIHAGSVDSKINIKSKETIVGQLVGSNNTTVASIDTKGNRIFVNMSHLVDLKYGKDLSFDADRDVFFYLYANIFGSYDKVPENISNLKMSVKASYFYNSSNPTRILIHDYQDGMEGDFYSKTFPSLLSGRNLNVILVDWGLGANESDYAVSRFRVEAVSKVVAKFIKRLIEMKLATYDSIAIVGHGFGSHIAGLACKQIAGGKVKMILGLDPAGPLFNPKDPSNRLDASDAQNVQVIHTGGDGFGMHQPIGQSDFYVNYGRTQPICKGDLVCDHKRSYQHYERSIPKSVFDIMSGHNCENYNQIVEKNCPMTQKFYPMGHEPPTYGLTGIFLIEPDTPLLFKGLGK